MPIIYKNGNIYGGASSADDVSFDDTNVEFSANNVQDAFEEVTKTLTQQEYDALSTAEKNNGTIYLISDGTATNVVECTQATYPSTPEQDTFYLISDTGKIMYNGQEYSGVNYGSVLPMSPSDSTKVDAAINSKADASTTYTKTEVDTAISGVMPTSGSNTNGNWIKFPDGTMICTKKVTISVAQSDWTAWGSCYETPVNDCGAWAQSFNSTPVINVTSTGSAGWLEYFFDTSATNVGKTRMVRPSIAGAEMSYYLNIVGIGRWKA